MTLSEVSKLLDAGFTKDEIMAFENPAAAAPILTDAPAPADDPAPAEEPAPVETPAPAEEPAPANDPVMSKLNDNITKLIKTIQASNLAVNSTDKPASADLNKQVDLIMESLIRPIKGGSDK